MTNHRVQEQFDRAKWRLWLLTPLWASQLTLAMAITGLFSWRFGHTISQYKERGEAINMPNIELVWEMTNIVMSTITAICTLVQIAKYCTGSLTPWTMLFTNIVSLTCASAILALDVVIYVQRSDAHNTLVGLCLDGILIITAIFLGIYAIRAYCRTSSYEGYDLPANVKSYGFNDGLERHGSYPSRLGLRSSVDKRSSFGSARLSIGSAAYEPLTLQPLEQTPRRYSHERDTQFDEYMSRRGSFIPRADVERGVVRSSSPRESLGDTLAVPGNVQSRSRSVSQATSFSNDHLLVAVPEEEDDVADAADQLRAAQGALLGHEPRQR